VISVLLPVRNVEPYLEAAVDSILNQTFRDFELVAIDDGSTDRTLEILQRYAAQDARVRLIHSDHIGAAAAANLGLFRCQYDWVAVMHGDDVALPTRLERQYEMSRSDPEVVIWGTDGYHINSKGEILSSFRVGPTSKAECRQMRRQGEIVQAIHPTVLLNRRVAIEAGGYDETLVPSEDIDLFDRMLKYGDLVTVAEPLMKYRIHGASLSMTKAARMAMMRRFITARQRHRLVAHEELTLERFLPQDQARSMFSRLRDWMLTTGGNCYRTAGMYYGERRYAKAALFLIASLAVRPIGSSRRLWWQIFSARARRNIRAYRSGQEQPF
jgi:glycosyltransferase involved in cell wall biosynthesis